MRLRPAMLCALLAACDGQGSSDAGSDPTDAGGLRDGGGLDAGSGMDSGAMLDSGTTLDAGGLDAGAGDAGDAGALFDAGSLDAGSFDAGYDAGPYDGGYDAGPRDAGYDAGFDAGPPPPPGLSEPCSNGPGWTLFRFHYDGSTSPRVDVWDATCSYSYAPGSACNVVDVYGALVMSGYAMGLDGSDYIRVRFSVAGLTFTRAAVYVQARSYSTSASTNIRVWSPLYGDQAMGPVDNDWTYDWYGMDWSGALYPDDEPGLTAIQIYPYLGSGSLAVHAVELCVE